MNGAAAVAPSANPSPYQPCTKIRGVGYMWIGVSAMVLVIYPLMVTIGKKDERLFHVLFSVIGALICPLLFILVKYFLTDDAKFKDLRLAGPYVYTCQMKLIAVTLFVCVCWLAMTVKFLLTGQKRYEDANGIDGGSRTMTGTHIGMIVAIVIFMLVEIGVGVMLSQKYRSTAQDAARKMTQQGQAAGAAAIIRSRTFKQIIDKAMWQQVGAFAAITMVCVLLVWVVYFIMMSYIVLLAGLFLVFVCSYGTMEVVSKHFDLIESAAEMRLRAYELGRDVVFVWTAICISDFVAVLAMWLEMDPAFVQYSCCQLPVEDAVRMWIFFVMLVLFCGLAVRIIALYDDHADKVNECLEAGWTSLPDSYPPRGVPLGPPPGMMRPGLGPAMNVNVAPGANVTMLVEENIMNP